MINNVIEEALCEFRELMFSEIKAELLNTKGHKVRLDLSIPGDIDEYRYHHNIIKFVYLEKNSEQVMVKYMDDSDGEEYQDGIDLFTVDEILEIINAM